MNYKLSVAIIMAMFFTTTYSFAQLTMPPSGNNQKSVVTQYMGLTHVTVTYNSPDVHTEKGEDRTGKIWGEVVPYGYSNLYFGKSSKENPSPWRAGANQNTTIQFSHDMIVGGASVKAGIYGLFMVPAEGEWEVLLSSNSTAWGSSLNLLSFDLRRYCKYLVLRFASVQIASPNSGLEPFDLIFFR